MRRIITYVLSRWADSHPMLRLAALALVLGFAVVVVVPSAWTLFRQWRLERNLGEARKAVDEERMIEARDLSLSVLRSGDPRIEAFRILEISAQSLRDPRHGEIARALMFHPDSSDDDRLRGFLGIVDRLPLGLVGRVWAELPASCQQDARFAALFAKRLTNERRLGEAGIVLLGVPEENQDESIQQSLVRLLIESGAREGYQKAQKQIESHFARSAESLPGWLALLEDVPAHHLEPTALASVRARLAEHADDARHDLLAARIESRADFANRARVIDRAVAKWRDSQPGELARFLSALNLHQQLLDTFSDERIGECAGLLKRILEAAASVGDWGRYASLLDSHGGLLTEVERWTCRTAHAAATGDGTTRGGWTQAMQAAAAADDDDSLLRLHRAASRMGLGREAGQALLAAIRRGRGPLPLYADLKPWLVSLVAAGQEQALLEIVTIYLNFEPANPVLLTQYAYLACLNELAEPATIIEALTPLAGFLPDEFPVWFTLAAAHLSDGRPDLAAGLIEKWKADEARLPPSFRAIALATRVLGGEIPANDPAIRDFPQQDLLPIERRRFNAWVRE